MHYPFQRHDNTVIEKSCIISCNEVTSMCTYTSLCSEFPRVITIVNIYWVIDPVHTQVYTGSLDRWLG